MNRPVPSALSVRVPFAVRKRGGRKLVITLDGTTERPRPRIDSALVTVLAFLHDYGKANHAFQEGRGGHRRPLRLDLSAQLDTGSGTLSGDAPELWQGSGRGDRGSDQGARVGDEEGEQRRLPRGQRGRPFERVARYLAKYLSKARDRLPGERRFRRSEGIVIPEEHAEVEVGHDGDVVGTVRAAIMETGAELMMLAFDREAPDGCLIGWAWGASWGCRQIRVEVTFRGGSVETVLIDAETGEVLSAWKDWLRGPATSVICRNCLLSFYQHAHSLNRLKGLVKPTILGCEATVRFVPRNGPASPRSLRSRRQR